MADIALPADLSNLLADYERRIRILETAPKLQNSAFPWYPGFVSAQESTSSTTYVDLATPGPFIDIPISYPGRVIVTVSAFCSIPAGVNGDIALFVDGSYYSQVLLVGSQSADMYANFSSSRIHFPFSTGTHTFSLKYRTTSGSSSFAARQLIVQPY